MTLTTGLTTGDHPRGGVDDHCDRCRGPLEEYTMSTFNKDIICMDCEAKELGAPGYEAAKIAEAREAAAGNTNYCGVGLSDADRAYLGLE